MLQVAENVQLENGRLAGDFHEPAGWSVLPIAPAVRQLRLYLGDPVSGPMVWLFNSTPSVFPEGQPRPEANPARTHRHHTPSFRVALGEQPRQFQFDRTWFGQDDYILLDANKVYTDPSGVDGFVLLLIFADRRGMHPANKHSASLSSAEAITLDTQGFGPFGEGLSEVHVRDDQATPGVALTLPRGVGHGGRAKGSLSDTSDWSPLSDGSKIAGGFMGDPTTGSVVIMSHNAPGAVESPAGRFATDTFRIITKGSCTVGGRVLSAGGFLALEAGSEVGEVVHGPEGSTQLLFVDDRSRWRPVDQSGTPVAGARLDEIAKVLAPFIVAKAAPVMEMAR